MEEIFPELRGIDGEIKKQIKIEATYIPYITRQNEDIKLLEKEKSIVIPDNFDYDEVGGLTGEVREKLKLHRPYNLEIASRISGVTPAAIINIMITLKGKG
jgi:tRNA uridine 5-carboxymethylaminomethyl modification enzyme